MAILCFDVYVFFDDPLSNSDSVTFLYLIDGEYSEYRFHRIIGYFKDFVSDLIAVGIVNTDRRRDLLYVNGADKFLDFLTSELIELIEKNYKVKNRILFGHSLGGGFTMYSMINKPNYFNSYIALSPTPILDLIKKENFLKIDSQSNNNIVFYFSYVQKI